MYKKCEEILKELEEESKIKVWWTFVFPEKTELRLRLRDILENYVDEKYYLDDKKVLKIKNSNFMQEKARIQEKDYRDTLCARDWKDPKCVQVGELDMKGIEQMKRVYSPEGLCPTLTTMGGGNTEPKIEVLGNYMPSGHDASRIVGTDGIAPTVKENHGTVTAIAENKIVERTPLKFLNRNQKNIEGDYAFCVDCSNTGGIKEITETKIRVRKLTPRECWRLMGFSDWDFEKAMKVPTSNTQLYKQARKLDLCSSSPRNI